MNLCTTGEFPIHFLVPITNPKMLQCEQSVVSQRDYPYSSNILMAKNKQKVSCISRTIAKVNVLNQHQLPLFFPSFWSCVLYAKLSTMLLISSSRGMWRVAYAQLNLVELVEHFGRFSLRSVAMEGRWLFDS